jgi:hypothetical protein
VLAKPLSFFLEIEGSCPGFIETTHTSYRVFKIRFSWLISKDPSHKQVPGTNKTGAKTNN